MADNDGAHVLRRNGKAAITRQLRALSRHVAEENAESVRAELDALKRYFVEFEAAHYTYHYALVDDDEFAASDAWFQAVDDDYTAGVRAARAWLKTQSPTCSPGPVRSQPVVTDPVKEVVPCDNAPSVSGAYHMPDIDLNVFDGNPSDYYAFLLVLISKLMLRCLMQRLN